MPSFLICEIEEVAFHVSCTERGGILLKHILNMDIKQEFWMFKVHLCSFSNL